jgi:hypothetical protein
MEKTQPHQLAGCERVAELLVDVGFQPVHAKLRAGQVTIAQLVVRQRLDPDAVGVFADFISTRMRGRAE